MEHRSQTHNFRLSRNILHHKPLYPPRSMSLLHCNRCQMDNSHHRKGSRPESSSHRHSNMLDLQRSNGRHNRRHQESSRRCLGKAGSSRNTKLHRYARLHYSTHCHLDLRGSSGQRHNTLHLLHQDMVDRAHCSHNTFQRHKMAGLYQLEYTGEQRIFGLLHHALLCK